MFPVAMWAGLPVRLGAGQWRRRSDAGLGQKRLEPADGASIVPRPEIKVTWGRWVLGSGGGGVTRDGVSHPDRKHLAEGLNDPDLIQPHLIRRLATMANSWLAQPAAG